MSQYITLITYLSAQVLSDLTKRLLLPLTFFLFLFWPSLPPGALHHLWLLYHNPGNSLLLKETWIIFSIKFYLMPYVPAIPLLGIHTEEIRSEKDTCTPMFITALFIIARTWKQPRCPSADEWIRELWYIYTTEYYSAIKKNSFESVLMRWVKLEPIIQSEVSQKDKNQYSILTHI